MGSKELWLRLASVAALGVPVLLTRTVDNVAAGTRDLDTGSRDGDQWTCPFLISKSCGSLEDDLEKILLDLKLARYACRKRDYLTDVPLTRFSKFKVVPAGTTMSLRVMLEQEALFLIASAAPVLPEKVQADALGARTFVAVGAAATRAADWRPMLTRVVK